MATRRRREKGAILMGKYFDELSRAMEYLGEQPDTMFLGQAVEYADRSKLLEMPVDEEMQMGITNGLAVNGTVPVSIYPRWNFLLCAMNQLVNHLDRMKEYSHAEYIPKTIIRVGIGSVRPLNPQVQHTGDFTQVFRGMLRNTEVIRCDEPEDIFPAYYKAYNRTDGKSTIVVEYGDYYGEK